MSKSELHDWECEIEELSGNNADKMLDIAQDIYNTAFVRGKNYMTWEQPRWISVNERLPKPQEDGISYRSGRLLVTIEVKRFSNGCVSKDTCVTEGYYCFSDKKWHTRIHNDVNVIAWRPLPEPYKGRK